LNNFRTGPSNGYRQMKALRQAMAVVFFAACSLKGYAVETPSLDLATILQHVSDRAKVENDNDRTFKTLYTFSRQKINEVHNGDGDLLKREVKIGTHQAGAGVQAPKKEMVGTPKDQHPALQGQSFDKNELLNEDTIKRFTFSLVGEDEFNGRHMLLVDFVPRKNAPEHSIKERLINKAAGRVWVDAQDYSVVKADLHLTSSVSIGLGLVALHKFNYSFERARTDDGLWFTKNSSWHLESREGIFDRVRDHQESISDLSRPDSVASR